MNTENQKKKSHVLLIAAILSAWLLIVLILSIGGVWMILPFWAFSSNIVFGVLSPFVMYLKVHSFHAYIDTFSIRSLTLFHLWRVIVGFYFLKLGSQGFLPLAFTRNAGFGDVIVGLACVLFIFWSPKKRGYIMFHLLSMTDFIIAVGTGLVLVVLQKPLMRNIQTFPVALIPGFGVGVTGALSLITLYRLFKN